MRLADIINYVKLKLFTGAQTGMELLKAAAVSRIQIRRQMVLLLLKLIQVLTQVLLLQVLPQLYLQQMLEQINLLDLPLDLLQQIQRQQKSHLKGWVTKVLPEDFLGELETLRDKWFKEGRSKLKIRLMTGIYILDMLKAHIQIEMENAKLFKIIARQKN